jgi:hypothetical protein
MGDPVPLRIGLRHTLYHSEVAETINGDSWTAVRGNLSMETVSTIAG